MIRHQVARILSALADRIDPQPQPNWDEIFNRMSGQIIGRGVAGRAFPPDSVQRWTY